LADADSSSQFVDLPGEKLVDWLRQMLLIRRFDEMALSLRLDGRIAGVVHPYIGEEAVAVGVMAALRPDDRVTSHHRGHGHCIAKGAEPQLMMAELLGRRDGYCRGKGGSMHIAYYDGGILGANGIVGAGIPIAAGAALEAKLCRRDDVAVAFFGDGATGQGIFAESLSYSAVAKLPVIWVCENNQWAVETPLSMSIPVADVAEVAAGYGLPCQVLDGTDIFAVYRAATAAVSRARAGDGPTFLECKTHRWGVHSQRGAPVAETRPKGYVEWAKTQDPIVFLERWLTSTQVATQHEIDELHANVDTVIAEALDFAEASPLPDRQEALEDVYA
jgi:pyruvate dehydrogenase E1 component alpha subunit